MSALSSQQLHLAGNMIWTHLEDVPPPLRQEEFYSPEMPSCPDDIWKKLQNLKALAAKGQLEAVNNLLIPWQIEFSSRILVSNARRYLGSVLTEALKSAAFNVVVDLLERGVCVSFPPLLGLLYAWLWMTE